MSEPIHLFDSDEPQERIGVYVCHCGTNIAGIVNVEEVRDWAGSRLKDRGVVVARDYKFMCSSLGQENRLTVQHGRGGKQSARSCCHPGR